MTTKLTVAIPTHNRASALGETLRSVFALDLPAGIEAECVLVDNGSTDATAAVFEARAQSAQFPARRVFEPRLGSSFARNRAIEEARGDLLFFIDDDAIAEPDWAAQLLAEMERRNLDAACGMVLARWTEEPPSWLGPRLWVKLAVHDPRVLSAAGPSDADQLHNYFSANVGFRRSTFERFGRFREDLGVVGANPISGEDTELFARIIAGGGGMGFAPRAIVHHVVGRDRMTRSYFRRKGFAYGMGSAAAGGRRHNRLDKLIRNVLRMGAAVLRGDGEGALYHQIECANFFGYWYGRTILRRRAAKVNQPRS